MGRKDKKGGKGREGGIENCTSDMKCWRRLNDNAMEDDEWIDEDEAILS